ncbi:MAG: hypothetical protein JWO30_2534 [Fibrobacteres bacterium]|nr:hypothetical protein [Fibrobacterota bacterium]
MAMAMMQRFRSFPLWPAGAFLVFAILHFALLYHPGLARLDDFGYLHNAVETIVRGRPYTHDFLSPYSATTSVLSALAYAATGDFPGATWGLLSLFACGNFFLLYLLFRGRLASREAAILALAAATIPAYWYKCSEYTGTVFTLTFVLAALLAYRRGSWAWFFPAAFLAFANRQNSIALMALPAYHLFFDARLSPAGKRFLAAGLAGFAAACMALHLSMNHTASQTRDIDPHIGFGKALLIARTCFIGICIGLALLSFFGLLSGKSPGANLRANRKRPWAPLAASLLFAALLLPGSGPFFRPHTYVEFCTPLLLDMDAHNRLQWVLGLCVPLLLWTLDWKQAFRFNGPACLFIAYVAISAQRGFWYDFYFIDLALAILFIILAAPEPMRPARWAPGLTCLLLLANAAWGYGYKVLAEKESLYLRTYERLERSENLGVDRMTSAPWGYLGWKLYDHHALHTPDDPGKGFGCYLMGEQVVVETQLPWRRTFKRGGVPEGAEILEAGSARIGFFRVPFRVMDMRRPGIIPGNPSCYLPLDRAAYQPRPFPLDAGEWSSHIAARRRAFSAQALKQPR